MKTMRAAIYLRKSTDEQADSIETQRDSAERWCASQGFVVVDSFEDSGISRTEFSAQRRRGWFAMQAAAAAKLFEVVVVRDVARIGGSIGRALVFVEDMLQSGVRVYCYVDGREVTAKNAIECVTLALQFFGAQGEVEAIRSRTREALFVKARKGYVAGGAVYGYRNKPSEQMVSTKHGQRPAHVERVVDPKQADVVREIFRRYSLGEGLRAIAKELNRRGVPSPRAGGRGIGTWVPSVIHSMLRRPLYAGRIEWGKIHKTYLGDSKIRTESHDRPTVFLDAPHLRVIDVDLWQNVADKIDVSKRRRSPGTPPKHLLSGILRCGTCCGPLTVANGRSGAETILVYTCQRRRDRGHEACSASTRRPVEALDRRIVQWAQEHALKPRIVEALIVRLREAVKRAAVGKASDAKPFEAEIRKLDRQIENLIDAVAEAPRESRSSLLDALNVRRARRSDLATKLVAASVSPEKQEAELRAIENKVRAALGDLHSRLVGAVAAARRVLSTLFPAGLVVSTGPAGAQIVKGVANVGIGLFVNSASPAGFGTFADVGAERIRLQIAA